MMMTTENPIRYPKRYPKSNASNFPLNILNIIPNNDPSNLMFKMMDAARMLPRKRNRKPSIFFIY